MTQGLTSGAWDWFFVLATAAVLLGYEVALFAVERTRPQRWARSAHAVLREEWFGAVSRSPGSEILAVQTLRNSLMSATMIASTAALALMGTVTLAAPSLHAAFNGGSMRVAVLTPRLVLELMMLTLLLASLVSSVMAVRYYNHVSFIVGMPVGSPDRERWQWAGRAYVRKAGLLYSGALRQLVLVAPLVGAVLHPGAGPVAAVVLVAILLSLDRYGLDHLAVEQARDQG
ncbi:DUF599 domain-containing protein [Azohydromonas aeria]|uniref:DUF599 domain-containing protein n=1 Tax=Azohydromonas aeria TaxID=2590212 RepID=UPI0012FC3F8E|nr:DUF599 domain-containing protein [Azohydromonas aeria]